MRILFELRIANVGSWNGQTSLAKTGYFVSKNVLKKDLIRLKEQGLDLEEEQSFYYGWDDGWGVSVSSKPITKVGEKEFNRLLRGSKGFLNYEWMIENIINTGDIYGDKK